MEQGINNNQNNQINSQEITSSVFTNSDSVTANTGYQIRTNNNNNLTLEENERINDKNNIVNGSRYHLTRNQGILSVLQDNSVQIDPPNIFNRVFAVRSQGNQFTLTRTPALTDYTFFTNSLQNNASFDILGERGSRCVHVINNGGLISKIGVLHVTQFRSIGLIDRLYFFEIIHNNINLPLFSLNPSNAATSIEAGRRSMVVDIENQNIFVETGDCIGIRYVVGQNGRTGDYCQVRISVDTNARRDNFELPNIP